MGLFNKHKSKIQLIKEQLQNEVEIVLKEIDITDNCRNQLRKEMYNIIRQDDNVEGVNISYSVNALLNNLAFEELSTKKYNLRPGIIGINSVGDGKSYLTVYKHTLIFALKNDYITNEEYENQLYVLNCQLS